MDKSITIQGVELKVRPLKIKYLRKLKDLISGIKDVKFEESTSVIDIVLDIASADTLQTFAEIIFFEQDLSEIDFDDLDADEVAEMVEGFFLANPKTTNALKDMFGSLDLAPLMNSVKPAEPTP